MRIAVNTRFLLSEYLEGYGYFLLESLQYIVKKYGEHQFIFIFDRPYDDRFDLGPNVIPVVTGPPARHPILWKFWYDIRIPAVLRKFKADVFVSPDGFCSLATSVPQCLIVHDLAFLHYPMHYKKSHRVFFKKYMPRYLEKAKTVVTVSEFSKRDIINSYKTRNEKITVVYNAAKKIFKPIDNQLIETIKRKYTGGTDYFLCVGAIHPRKNLLNLLKAFSIFKKRLKSGFKLVITGRLAWMNESFIRDLKKYKYREDVILTGYVSEDELVKITGSAYAAVYPSLFEGFGVPIIEAMNCDVPVITSSNSAMQEIAGEAALYADPASFEDIAEKMMLIYKDETLREQLVMKGREIAKKYSHERTAELLWESILRTAG